MSLSSSTRVSYPTATPPPVPVAGLPVSAKTSNVARALLAAYTAELSARPLRTKCITVAIFNFIQDIIGNHVAGVPPKRVAKDAPLYEKLAARLQVDSRAFKMMLYGFFVSAPLSHAVTGWLQRAFAGKTNTLPGKLAQILASCLISSPITAVSYLACTAIINGARTKDQVLAVVKGGFPKIIKISWMTTPASMLFAQYYLSPEMWVPFFNSITFILGLYFNIQVKKSALAAKKKEQKKD